MSDDIDLDSVTEPTEAQLKQLLKKYQQAIDDMIDADIEDRLLSKHSRR